MKFNIDIYKDVQIRYNNHYTNYTMNGSKLSKVSHEKDLGVTINNDLKPSKHCSDIVKTANKLGGMDGCRGAFQFAVLFLSI